MPQGRRRRANRQRRASPPPGPRRPSHSVLSDLSILFHIPSPAKRGTCRCAPLLHAHTHARARFPTSPANPPCHHRPGTHSAYPYMPVYLYLYPCHVIYMCMRKERKKVRACECVRARTHTHTHTQHHAAPHNTRIHTHARADAPSHPHVSFSSTPRLRCSTPVRPLSRGFAPRMREGQHRISTPTSVQSVSLSPPKRPL